MVYLRQSTASQEVEIGPFVDSSDGNTEETGLTIANTDIKLWKSGATTQANKNSGGATHIAAGMYYIVLDATDTNTIGPMKISVHVSGALYVVESCVVLAGAVYDVLFGTTAPSTLAAGALMGLADSAITTAKFAANAINAAAIADGAIDAATFAAGAINAAAIAADAIGASELAADAASEIATAVATALGTGSGLSALATAAELAKVPKSDGSASWNATALAAINAEVDGALNTAIPGSPTANSINERIATMDDGLTAARLGTLTDWIDGGRLDLLLDTLLTRLSSARAGYLDLLNTYLDATISSRLATSGYTAPPDAAAIRAAAGLAAANLDAQLAALAAYIDTEVAAILEDTGTTLPAAIAAVSAPSAAAVAAAVLDETLAGHAGAGSVGAAIAAAGAAGDPWIANLPGSYGAGTAGAIIGSFLSIPRTPFTPGAPPVSAFEIAELALRECDDFTILSATTFSAPAPDVKQEILVAKFYDLVRRDVLRAAPWTCIAKRAPLAANAWAASTAFSLGARMYAGGYVYEATTGGTSGATAPTWVGSGTVADGSVVWTYLYAYKRLPGENYSEFEYAIPVPSDYINQIEVYDQITGKAAADFRLEADILYTDVEFPILLYVPDSGDVQHWDAHLTSAMVYALAGRLMTPLSGDEKKALTLLNLAAGAAAQATGATRRERKQGPQPAEGWYK
jgi:hypothetical protein